MRIRMRMRIGRAIIEILMSNHITFLTNLMKMRMLEIETFTEEKVMTILMTEKNMATTVIMMMIVSTSINSL